MNAETFLQILRASAPAREELERYGLDEAEVAAIQATFTAPARSAKAADGATEIERMIVEYDCSRVELGLVRLRGQIAMHARGLSFASCEGDPLVIRDDGSVVMCDHDNLDGPELGCADDDERFLEAMAEFVRLRAEKARWVGRSEEAGRRCAVAAGGSHYREFYTMLCGFLG